MIEFVDECESTQNVIVTALKMGAISPPYALVASRQSLGVGSRGNRWQGEDGNLYFSFAIDVSSVASDLLKESASIYFSCLMTQFLREKGSKIWVKWPNDFYINHKKIGGVITTVINQIYVCGIGINLKNSPNYSDILDIDIDAGSIAWGYCELLKQKISWKQIFSMFVLEFQKSRGFVSHSNGSEISLKDAVLCDDGSILINNKKVYSLR